MEAELLQERHYVENSESQDFDKADLQMGISAGEAMRPREMRNNYYKWYGHYKSQLIDFTPLLFIYKGRKPKSISESLIYFCVISLKKTH